MLGWFAHLIRDPMILLNFDLLPLNRFRAILYIKKITYFALLREFDVNCIAERILTLGFLRFPSEPVLTLTLQSSPRLGESFDHGRR